VINAHDKASKTAIGLGAGMTERHAVRPGFDRRAMLNPTP
jgi:hypothetical protein